MSDIITMLNLINDAIFVSLVNTTWQMTILIPLIALVIWVFRIKSATTHYSLWLFVLFAIIALLLLTPLIPQIDFAQLHRQRGIGDGPDDMMRLGMGGGDAGELSEDGDPLASMSAAKAVTDKEVDVSLINPVSIAYFIWCAGALFMFWITLGAYRKLRRLKISSPDVKDGAALEMLSRLKQKIKVGRPVALKVSSEIYTPISLGIFSPTIILPDGVIDDGSAKSPFENSGTLKSPFSKGGFRGIYELEMILTHELAHIKRCDYLINFLQNILKTIFFFHPLFHLMNRNLAKEREHICDDWVIDITEQRSGYAECIIGLLEKALYKPVNVPVTIAMAERKRDIPGRIDMIVDKKRKITTRASRRALIAMFLIGCLSLPVIGGIELVRFAVARPASDEGWIVFARSGAGGAKSGIWVMDADGRNQRQLTFGRHYHPEYSPDGTKIAFGEYAKEVNGIIYVMDADGSNVNRLTDGADDQNPTWSPDGKQIAFTREVWEQKDGEWNIKSGSIYVMDADGSNLRKLAEKKGQMFYRNPDWSPDGRKIAFHENRVTKSYRIWVMDADGGDQKMVRGSALYPAWSPDGERIAFHSYLPGWQAFGKVEFSDICVMDADGANVEVLTDPDQSSDTAPAWSPDGRKIAFSSKRDGNWEIYVMNADGSNAQRITNTPQQEGNGNWTAFSYAVEPAGKLKATWGKIKRGLFSR